MIGFWLKSTKNYLRWVVSTIIFHKSGHKCKFSQLEVGNSLKTRQQTPIHPYVMYQPPPSRSFSCLMDPTQIVGCKLYHNTVMLTNILRLIDKSLRLHKTTVNSDNANKVKSTYLHCCQTPGEITDKQQTIPIYNEELSGYSSIVLLQSLRYCCCLKYIRMTPFTATNTRPPCDEKWYIFICWW